MLDPYKMVTINIVSSIILLGGLLFYKFVFPKRKVNLFILLLLVSILPIISVFRTGDYESGDFNIHIYRIMVFYDSLKEGIFMPSWAGELNATYGNPLFIFNYSLPYYIISFFHFMGISFIDSTKIYLGLTFYLSGIFMYLWIKKLLGNSLAAFASSIFYLFNPYHLIDVHFRATLGESTIFALVPLQFFFIIKYLKEKKSISLIPISLVTALLFLAHPLLACVFFLLEIIYILFVFTITKRLKPTIFTAGALLLGVLSSLYTLLPFILYSPYTYKLQVSSAPIAGFYPFQQLFYSPWRLGLLFQGPYGELALIIGYTQIFVLIISIILIILKKIHKEILRDYLFWIILFFVFLFLMHPISKILWNKIPTIANMLILYGRLSLVLSLCTSVIVGYFTVTLLKLKARKIYIYLLLTFAILSTILNWGHRRVIPEIDDAVLRENVWKSTLAEGPTAYFLNTKWADIKNFWFPKPPAKPLEIIKGKGSIKNLEKTSTKHFYIINAQTPVTIKENTLYFPGWTLKSNSKQISIYPEERGVINAKLTQGLHYLEFTYEDLPLYKISKIVGVVILAGLLTILFFLRLSTKPQHFSRQS